MLESSTFNERTVEKIMEQEEVEKITGRFSSKEMRIWEILTERVQFSEVSSEYADKLQLMTRNILVNLAAFSSPYTLRTPASLNSRLLQISRLFGFEENTRDMYFMNRIELAVIQDRLSAEFLSTSQASLEDIAVRTVRSLSPNQEVFHDSTDAREFLRNVLEYMGCYEEWDSDAEAKVFDGLLDLQPENVSEIIWQIICIQALEWECLVTGRQFYPQIFLYLCDEDNPEAHADLESMAVNHSIRYPHFLDVSLHRFYLYYPSPNEYRFLKFFSISRRWTKSTHQYLLHMVKYKTDYLADCHTVTSLTKDEWVLYSGLCVGIGIQPQKLQIEYVPPVSEEWYKRFFAFHELDHDVNKVLMQYHYATEGSGLDEERDRWFLTRLESVCKDKEEAHRLFRMYFSLQKFDVEKMYNLIDKVMYQHATDVFSGEFSLKLDLNEEESGALYQVARHLPGQRISDIEDCYKVLVLYSKRIEKKIRKNWTLEARHALQQLTLLAISRINTYRHEKFGDEEASPVYELLSNLIASRLNLVRMLDYERRFEFKKESVLS